MKHEGNKQSHCCSYDRAIGHDIRFILFRGCKELSYELTYDISADREVTLPFAGVTFETSNDRTLMTWQNVPNLYSFTYSVNGGEEREVTAGENTSPDITSYLPENARRALVEITDVTYSYPVYDDNGEPTEETREVVHDDVMKFVAEL